MAILEEDLMVALKTWGDALILISKDYEASGIDQARHTASEILDNAYGFDLGPVLFKPTLSGGEKTFRITKKGALCIAENEAIRYHINGQCAVADNTLCFGLAKILFFYIAGTMETWRAERILTRTSCASLPLCEALR